MDNRRTWQHAQETLSEDERKDLGSWITPDFRRLRNSSNNYLQDRAQQRTTTYTGIAAVNSVEQGGCATESMGRVWDRTKEHLGYSDKTIIAVRKMLLCALDDLGGGRGANHLIYDEQLNNLSRLRSSGRVTDRYGLAQALEEINHYEL
ncbi:MAG TPA: hypothetical protein VGH22_16075 [Candidatus Binatia bacterium]